MRKEKKHNIKSQKRTTDWVEMEEERVTWQGKFGLFQLPCPSQYCFTVSYWWVLVDQIAKIS